MSLEEDIEECGELVGHKGWVTAVACPPDPNVPPTERIVTASRDKTLISWKLLSEDSDEYRKKLVGYPVKRLHGHSHHVEDVIVSSDGQFALSGSWDNSLRLWDLSTGSTSRTFIGHKKDVMSIAFSADNRQIVSASRDKTIRIWNTLGECKLEFGPDQSGHTDWVSCVRFSPDQVTPMVVSCGWDKKIKVWDLTSCKLKCDLVGHTGYINTISVSPDGSLCASGGKDGTAILWDLTEAKRLYSLEPGDIIHALCFSPNHYWLCAATQSGIKIWDLESKKVVYDLKPQSFEGKFQSKKAIVPYCVSLTWSADGTYLLGGYTDGVVRIWEVVPFGKRMPRMEDHDDTHEF